MILRYVRTRLIQTGYAYTLANTLVSFLVFGRNFLFIKTLNLADVSQIAIMQTIVMMVGFIQIGTINGAYLLFSEQKTDQTRQIVNLLFWGIAGLIILTSVAAQLGGDRLFAPLIAPETMIFGCFAGIATLASTWMNNLLIAKGALGRSNTINLIAVSCSLALALLSSDYGLHAALISILAQPLMIVTAIMITDHDVRPSIVVPDMNTLTNLLSLGFMPFMGGMFTLITYQLERWTIAVFLGQEGLGKFYLVIMYMTFFGLIPAALLNVSLPRAMRAYQAGLNEEFTRIRKRHLIEILIYGTFVAAGTVLILPILVKEFIPEYQYSTRIIILLFPALLVFNIGDNAALALYAIKNTRPIFLSSLILLASYAALLGGAGLLGQFSLSSIVILRGLAVLLSTAYLFWASRNVLRGSA